MENITTKEYLIGIAVFMVSVAIAFFGYPVVRDGLLYEYKSYQNAIKLTDATQFSYAKNTQVGNIMGYGELIADEEQTIPELLNKYGGITKVKEEYNQHQYTTCTTDSNGNETCTTHIYYSWDYDGSSTVISPTFTFLGVVFNINQLDITPNINLKLNKDTFSQDYIKNVKYERYLYKEDKYWESVGDVRWYYEVFQIKTTGTLYTKFLNKMNNANFYENMNFEQVLEQKENWNKVVSVLYFLLVIVFIVGIYFYLAYAVLEIE
jgi:hypothetical protein